MRISIVFNSPGFSISPDPAFVTLGDSVEWDLSCSLADVPGLLWTVYLSHGSPFGHAQSTFSTLTQRTQPRGIALRGVLGPEVTVTDGDYKYGIRVADPNSLQVLGDDDPWLIVRR
ncbi:MAG TPA: hypothetical protein VN345_16260 [Blastocatellia bacterium]|jgi:hypothetical protein|nr:hypothetical protein [Blastocatellia bacterium]